MAWLAVNKSGLELISNSEPFRNELYNMWVVSLYSIIPIPQGSIEKLIGRKLTWEDEPVEI